MSGLMAVLCGIVVVGLAVSCLVPNDVRRQRVFGIPAAALFLLPAAWVFEYRLGTWWVVLLVFCCLTAGWCLRTTITGLPIDFIGTAADFERLHAPKCRICGDPWSPSATGDCFVVSGSAAFMEFRDFGALCEQHGAALSKELATKQDLKQGDVTTLSAKYLLDTSGIDGHGIRIGKCLHCGRHVLFGSKGQCIKCLKFSEP